MQAEICVSVRQARFPSELYSLPRISVVDLQRILVNLLKRMMLFSSERRRISGCCSFPELRLCFTNIGKDRFAAPFSNEFSERRL